MIPKDRAFQPYHDSVIYKSIADAATHHGIYMREEFKRELATFAQEMELAFDRELHRMRTSQDAPMYIREANGELRIVPPSIPSLLSKEQFKALLEYNARV